MPEEKLPECKTTFAIFLQMWHLSKNLTNNRPKLTKFSGNIPYININSFQELFFGLSKGDKMALIANNGTGKSSMLKIIAGKDVSESGITLVILPFLMGSRVVSETKTFSLLLYSTPCKIVN